MMKRSNCKMKDTNESIPGFLADCTGTLMILLELNRLLCVVLNAQEVLCCYICRRGKSGSDMGFDCFIVYFSIDFKCWLTS